ncbi:MAG: SagB/ThcOx family dehydrogenase [Halorhabdus sp.]|jgi:SagB-type dehydrogenase family enzyme
MTAKSYRINPAITVVPETEPGSDSPAFAVENLEKKKKYRLSDARMVEMIDLARNWITRSVLEGEITSQFDVDAETATTLVDRFIDEEFIVPEDRASPTFEREGRQWSSYGWDEAFEYYLYIYEYPYVDYSEGKEAFEEDFGRMQEYAETESIPPLYKRYEDHEQLSLPKVDEPELPSIGSVLSFTDKPTDSTEIDRSLLSQILFLTFGETGRVSFPHQGEFLLKTSPSGGARHPTEAYVAVFDIEDVPEGLYHYSVEDHALNILDQGDIEQVVRETIYELDMHAKFDVSFVIVLSSVVERSMWRYREPRSYSVVQNDIGHLLETLRLICNANGFETTFGHGFDDSELSDLLGLDRFEEPIFKYAPVGTPGQ